PPLHVRVCREQGRRRGFVQNHALPRPDHVMEHGFGKLRGRHGYLSKRDLNSFGAGRGLRLYLRLIAAEKDEQTPIGACMLDRNHHQGLHEVPQHDLAGYGLRSLDHRPEVELPKGRANRGGGRGRRSFLLQVRVALIELPHLAEGTPTEITVASVSKISVCARLIATSKIEVSSEFVRNALVLDEAVFPRRSDGLLIQA